MSLRVFPRQLDSLGYRLGDCIRASPAHQRLPPLQQAMCRARPLAPPALPREGLVLRDRHPTTGLRLPFLFRNHLTACRVSCRLFWGALPFKLCLCVHRRHTRPMCRRVTSLAFGSDICCDHCTTGTRMCVCVGGGRRARVCVCVRACARVGGAHVHAAGSCENAGVHICVSKAQPSSMTNAKSYPCSATQHHSDRSDILYCLPPFLMQQPSYSWEGVEHE